MQCLEIESGEQGVRCTENEQSRNPHYQYVHEYLAWVHKCLTSTRQEGHIRVDWSGDSLDAAGFHREFVTALHSRINHKGQLPQNGRKFDQGYQTSLRRDCYRVRDMARRIRVYQLETPEMRARFGHKLARYDG
jgi:hypothetical protein